MRKQSINLGFNLRRGFIMLQLIQRTFRSSLLGIFLAIVFGIWIGIFFLYDISWTEMTGNDDVHLSFDSSEDDKVITAQFPSQSNLIPNNAETQYKYYLIVGNCDHLNQEKSMTLNFDY